MNPEIHVDELITELRGRRLAALAADIQRYPSSNLRASDITDCDKYLVHSVLDWDKRKIHDEYLQAIFNAGKDVERKVVAELLNDGFDVISSQQAFEIKDKQGSVILRGHIDGKISYGGRKFPLEIKSMNIDNFRSIKSENVEEFTKRPLYRKYLRQMQLYLFGNNEEEGLFILTDLQGHYKYIPVYLDYGECERLLQRLESAWKHVLNKTYPEIPDNLSLCDKCPFNAICMPPVGNKGAEFMDSPETEQLLERRKELEPAANEYDAIDKELKNAFREIEDAVVGVNWRIVTRKSKPGTKVDVDALPEDIKKQYTVPTEPKVKVIFIDLREKVGEPNQ